MKVQIAKIKEWLLYFVAFTLTGYIYAIPVVIGLFVLSWIAEGRIKQKLITSFWNKYVLLFISFYVLHIVGMVYSTNMSFGWFDLEVKLSLFVFPVILASEQVMSFDKQKKFIVAFVSGLVINGLVCLAVALWRLLVENKLMFQYKDFSLVLHPSYYSMYIDVAMVLIFYVLTEKGEQITKRDKIFLGVSAFFMEFVLVLLQSKTGLIVSFLVIGIVIIRYAIRKAKWVATISITIGGAVLFALSYHYIITAGRSRMLFAEKTLNQKLDSVSTESTQVRLFIWKSAWQVIKEHPILGTGTGDVKDKLLDQYSKDGITGAYNEKLNAHNEYIQCTTALGFVGLCALLAGLIIPFWKSIKEHRFVYTMFLVIIMINFLTESMFETQGGTIFYGLFNSLLMFNFVI